MSIKFLGVAFVLAALVIAPINKHFVGLDLTGGHRKDNETTADALSSHYESQGFVYIYAAGKGKHKVEEDESYLWAYLVFTYVFTGLAIYFLTAETRKIIKVRQDYLGSQSTITDKTIRISGIPGTEIGRKNYRDIGETEDRQSGKRNALPQLEIPG